MSALDQVSRDGMRRLALLSFRLPLTPARLVNRLLAPAAGEALDGRTVLVTGASSGIGREVALKLGSLGARVLLVARTAPALSEVEAEIEEAGGEAHAHSCDLTDTDAVEALATEVIEAYGGVDVLVNNAGHSIRRPVRESKVADYEKTIALNYLAPVRLTLSLLDSMEKRGGGHIININTLGLATATPRFSAYLGSKAALEAFGRCLHAEGRGAGIHVTTVHMPLVRTPMIEPTKAYRDMPALSPEEAADMVVEAIRTRAPRVSPRAAQPFELLWTLAPGAFVRTMSTAYELTRPRAEREEDGMPVGGLGASVLEGVGRVFGVRL